ncbi:hypothetical protein B0H66DRAFT_616979 [Apodospora peruviana]|uniref:Uncharacterized protein n=1 Tax=Apodospora peruviana TaxID=516989 RepID=A0AAE0MBI7_9PEZI|nr:hypothetical protein B0H66DRAFT_616979 [Apodospora peruviana]
MASSSRHWPFRRGDQAPPPGFQGRTSRLMPPVRGPDFLPQVLRREPRIAEPEEIEHLLASLPSTLPRDPDRLGVARPELRKIDLEPNPWEPPRRGFHPNRMPREMVNSLESLRECDAVLQWLGVTYGHLVGADIGARIPTQYLDLKMEFERHRQTVDRMGPRYKQSQKQPGSAEADRIAGIYRPSEWQFGELESKIRWANYCLNSHYLVRGRRIELQKQDFDAGLRESVGDGLARIEARHKQWGRGMPPIGRPRLQQYDRDNWN